MLFWDPEITTVTVTMLQFKLIITHWIVWKLQNIPDLQQLEKLQVYVGK